MVCFAPQAQAAVHLFVHKRYWIPNKKEIKYNLEQIKTTNIT